ncbi:MAG: DNA translocase FtsK 4TM domain-containing protein [Bacteroidales bacterium]|nr:DNA translocase FtsK 4TM domain-containing protein [Bacteroidales bacterium]
MFGFWKNLDDRDKAMARILAGLVVAIFAIFTLISNVSYLFTWKADQSLVMSPDSTAVSTEAANMGSGLGFRWARFLTGKCFGLGSFALVIILAAIAIRLLAHKWNRSLVRTILVSVTGAMIASLLLSYFGRIFSADTVFGGGLGGECGSTLVSWCENLFGRIVTGLILALLTALWLYFISDRFALWMTGLSGSVEEGDEREERKTARTVPPVPAPVSSPVFEKKKPEIKVPAKEPVPPVSDTKEGGQAEGNAGKEGDFEVITDDILDAEVTKDLPPFDNRTDPELGLQNYKAPSLDILGDYAGSHQEVPMEELTRNNNKIRATLANYKIQVNDVKAVVGPTVTLYKVYPAPGVKISAIKNLHEDIAMSLKAKGVRVVTLPDSVGIEVANDTPSIVPLKALFNDDSYRESTAELPVAIGYTITHKVKVFDLADAPHLLVAGATKQGKSVGLNVLIASLLYSKHPSELKFVFIDPKKVEFSVYGRLLHHYLAVLPDSANADEEQSNAIVKDSKRADAVLRSLCVEMDERYNLLEKGLVNNIKAYNAKFKDRKLLPTHGHRFLPYIVVVVDEFADLTMSAGSAGDDRKLARNINTSIVRLAQKGRAAGIHVVIATQRPSVDVITGLIKTNFPTRIAFKVATRVDSSTILDSPGAEKLIGKGDMLFFTGVDMERVQCAFISSEESDEITRFIGEQTGYKKSYNTPYYLPDVSAEAEGEGGGMIDMKNLDERFEEAARLVVQTQRGSTSDLQRKLGMGYAKAGRVMDQLEAAGIVGKQEGSKPRQVLVEDFNELEQKLNAFMNQ